MPFSAHFVEPSQEELGKPYPFLDSSEHGFNGLFAEAIRREVIDTVLRWLAEPFDNVDEVLPSLTKIQTVLKTNG